MSAANDDLDPVKLKALGGSPSVSEHSVNADAENERQAVLRLDCTVLPVMTVFYLLSFLDRGNIGNARVAGLQTDLHLTDHQYQIVLTILFIPYLVVELPSNLLLRRVGARILLPTLLTIWGVIVTLQGLVSSYAGLATVRFFLGLVEGPLYPAIVLYLSGFYTRKELSLRLALFFSAASLSGAFSGFLAAAIQNMDGIGGRPGWAWIFILEGLFTVFVGISGFFLVSSTPQESRFLSKAQKDIIVRRLEIDRPRLTAADGFLMKDVLRSFRSPHVLLLLAIGFMIGTTVYGLALFLPSIVSQLGFSSTKTQLLSVGPFAAGFVVTLISAYVSDRYESRGIPAAVVSTMAVTGYAMYLSTDSKYVAYASLYLTVSGAYGVSPILAAWMANNSEPHYSRATSIALGQVLSNCGGILSTWSFPTKEGPKFKKTTILNLIFSALILTGSLATTVLLSHMNKRKIRNRAHLLALYPDDGSGGKARRELGDQHPDFRYVL